MTDPLLQDALRRWILTLADSKRLMGLRYSDWLLGAPSIEAGIAASGMAQDEWGHARLLYAMLKDLGDDPVTIEQRREAPAYASVDVLDRACEDWADVVAIMVVVDGALTVALEGFAEGAHASARSRVPKMLSEEAFHSDLGLAWLGSLAGGTSAAGERLRDAVLSRVPRTLAWLAPDDATHARLVSAGLAVVGEESLERFRRRYAAPLAALDLELASVAPERDGWDEARGRGPGQPDEDAVERARGSRNRVLFVE